MNPGQAFRRAVAVAALEPEGGAFEIGATEDERARLAEAFDLPAVHALTGRFRLKPLAGGRVHVGGTVEASVEQTCVVTLEPLRNEISEAVDLVFAPEPALGSDTHAIDAPDAIKGGMIDLGALVAEFLAIGLDPYPRKPGAAFADPTGRGSRETPFAALAKLKGNAPR